MKKITTHLWFDKDAKKAAELYVSVFSDSKILSTSTISDTPSGTVEIVEAELGGQGFTLMAAGPYFTFNPSISFLVACTSKEEVETIYNKLIDGGKALMELGEYPFSAKYGWLQDEFGVSWQIMYMGDMPTTQIITPTLMFVGDQAGRAEEAINEYVGIFHDSSVGHIMRYEKGEPDKEGTIKHAGFTLEKVEFAAMDSSQKHEFAFNEAISFIVHCEDQKEVDYYWEKLSAVPESEQCGWIKDKFGVSWQIVPNILGELMSHPDKTKAQKVTDAMLKMKKLNIDELVSAAK